LALEGFAKAIAWFLTAVGQACTNIWDRLTHHAAREAERITRDADPRNDG
jgi:hypothetical protein